MKSARLCDGRSLLQQRTHLPLGARGQRLYERASWHAKERSQSPGGNSHVEQVAPPPPLRVTTRSVKATLGVFLKSGILTI